MLKQLQKYNISFVEKEVNHRHFCTYGAPNDWAKERGATHTLETIDGPRPAQVYKTFINRIENNPALKSKLPKLKDTQAYKELELAVEEFTGA